MTVELHDPKESRPFMKRAVTKARDRALHVKDVARDQAFRAKDAARELTRTSGRNARRGALVAASEVRKHPISTGVLALGLIAGGVLLLNPAFRRLAIAGAPALWRMARERIPHHA